MMGDYSSAKNSGSSKEELLFIVVVYLHAQLMTIQYSVMVVTWYGFTLNDKLSP